MRGRDTLHEFLNVPGVQVTALCDIVQEKVLQAKAMVEKAGQNTPAVYFKGERAFEDLPARFAMVELDKLVVPQPHVNAQANAALQPMCSADGEYASTFTVPCTGARRQWPEAELGARAAAQSWPAWETP